VFTLLHRRYGDGCAQALPEDGGECRFYVPSWSESGDSVSYVAGEVRRHDRDRFLTTLFVSPENRADLWALYAFNAEIARIPGSVSEPMLGRIKVQWWRDVITAIADGRGAPAGHRSPRLWPGR